MADEEKILARLDELATDMRTLKADVAALKAGAPARKNAIDPLSRKMSDWEIVKEMSHLLTKEEADKFGEFMKNHNRRPGYYD